jgi:Flp pilus assembly protein TadG
MSVYNERGASAVEFAIILPVLLVILFGIIEFSLLLFDKAVLTNASREGARAGIVHRFPTRRSAAEITTIVNTYCQNHLISFGSTTPVPTVTTDPADTSSLAEDDTLIVTVSYTYDFLLLPNFITRLAPGTNLVATTAMRAE